MSETSTAPWWICPNEPRCPHAAVIHDVYDGEDQVPRCCAEGCMCGDPGMTRAPARDERDTAEEITR